MACVFSSSKLRSTDDCSESVPKSSFKSSLVDNTGPEGLVTVAEARELDCWRCGMGAFMLGAAMVGIQRSLEWAGFLARVGVQGNCAVGRIERGSVLGQ